MAISTASASENLIYVDLSSACDNGFQKIKTKVLSLISSINNDRFLLFISDGNEPIICQDLKAAEKAFKDLEYRANPYVPDWYNDLDTLNTLFSKFVGISDVNELQRGISKEINFYFFLNPEQADFYDQMNRIVKRLLLVNRLYNKQKKLLDKVFVNVYFDFSSIKPDVKDNKLNKFVENYNEYEIKTL